MTASASGLRLGSGLEPYLLTLSFFLNPSQLSFYEGPTTPVDNADIGKNTEGEKFKISKFIKINCLSLAIVFEISHICICQSAMARDEIK